jgi:hypothetical protein
MDYHLWNNLFHTIMDRKPDMIHVTLYFAPENVPIALEACRALFTEAWKEPRLDFCQIIQSAEEPGVIRIQEAWNVTRKYLDEVGN